MTLLMGVARPHMRWRARADLGLAMQLTNIARDVGEDAATAGSTCRSPGCGEAGIDPDAALARGSEAAFDPGVGAVVLQLLEAADGFYALGADARDRSPGCLCRWSGGGAPTR
jgi:phytoene synthase